MYKLKEAQDNHQVAEFLISDDLIKNHPELVMDILYDKLVVRAESRFAEQAILYTCYCAGFKSLNQGEVIPRLKLDITWKSTTSNKGDTIVVPEDWCLRETP